MLPSHKLLYLKCEGTDLSCGSCHRESYIYTFATHMAPLQIHFCLQHRAGQMFKRILDQSECHTIGWYVGWKNTLIICRVGGVLHICGFWRVFYWTLSATELECISHNWLVCRAGETPSRAFRTVTFVNRCTKVTFPIYTSFIGLSTRTLQCVAMCCSVLQCVAVCCSVLQCVAV